jgi:peptidoglycan/xylan/chitin deacetylase (PgdA/CDA1 family)
MRALTKSIVQGTLTSPPAMLALRTFARGRSVVLGYHNVIPDDEAVTGEPSVHLRLSEFLWQLDLLSNHCDIVPLTAIMDTSGERRGRLRAAITFDDAYAGTILMGIPELVRRGMPATVFVPSSAVGGKSFWWDDLPVSGWQGDRTPLEALAGREGAIRDWAASLGLQTRPQARHQRTATVAELAEAGSGAGITFGVHTAGHPNLCQLTRFEIADELDANRAWLRQEGLPFVNWVAYPFGLADERVAGVARAMGFEGGLRISGGWIPRKMDSPFFVPRMVVPSGLSPENFLIRLYGVISG